MQEFLSKLSQNPELIQFSETIKVIDENYVFKPVEFINGDVRNLVGQNSGSCKIFSFALLHELNEEETLACFGEFYREDVLKQPNADNHANIRNFIKHGWAGINFSDPALS